MGSGETHSSTPDGGADGHRDEDARKNLHQSKWEMVLHPSMSFVNALPCDIEIEIVQPPHASISAAKRKGPAEDGALQLFYLPEQYYSRSSRSQRESNNLNASTSLHNQERQGWIPFAAAMPSSSSEAEAEGEGEREDGGDEEEDTRSVFLRSHALAVHAVVKGGASFEMPSFYHDRSLYFRVRFIDSDIWSKPKSVPMAVHQQRTKFDKHTAEPIAWDSANPMCSHYRRHAPRIFMKRVWRDSNRRLELFAKYWIINKSGVAVRYRPLPDPDIRRRRAEEEEDEEEEGGGGAVDAAVAAISDTTHAYLVNSRSIPLMVDCPARRLQVLPYSLMSTFLSRELHLYDFSSQGSQSYAVRRMREGLSMSPFVDTVQGAGAMRIVRWPPDILDPFHSDGEGMTDCTLVQTASQDGGLREESLVRFRASQHCMVILCLSIDGADGEVGLLLPQWAVELGFRRRQGVVTCTGVGCQRESHFVLFHRYYRKDAEVVLGPAGAQIVPDGGSGGRDGGRGVERDRRTAQQSMYFALVTPAAAPRPYLSRMHHVHDVDIKDMFTRRQRYCELPQFGQGDRLFVDSDLECCVLPPVLQGVSVLAVQTAQQDCRVQHVLRFRVEQNMRILLCIDRDTVHLPAWVSMNFTKSPHSLLAAYPRGGHSSASVDVEVGGGCDGESVEGSPQKVQENRADEVVFDIYTHLFGNADDLVVTFWSMARSGTKFNYFVMMVLESDYVKGGAIVAPTQRSAQDDDTGTGTGTGSTERADPFDPFSVEGLIESRKVNDFWDSNAIRHLSYQKPQFEPNGREWSPSFDVAHGNKGELIASQCNLSVSCKRLPGVFNRTSAIVLLPRFILFNKTRHPLKVLPFLDVQGPSTEGRSAALSGQPQWVLGGSGVDPLSTATGDVEMLTLPPNSSGIVYSFAEAPIGVEGEASPGRRSGEKHKQSRDARSRGVRKLALSVSAHAYAPAVARGRDSIPRTPSRAGARPGQQLPGGGRGEEVLSFSQPILCEDMSDQFVWLPCGGVGGYAAPKGAPPLAIMQASVVLEDTTVIITLEDATRSPPYLIENRASVPIRFRQNGTAEHWVDVEAHSWAAYVLFDGSERPAIEVAVARFETQSAVYALDDMAARLPRLAFGAREMPMVGGDPSGCLVGEVRVDGVTRVLTMFEVAQRATIGLSRRMSEPRMGASLHDEVQATAGARMIGTPGPVEHSSSMQVHANCIFPGVAVHLFSENLAFRGVDFHPVQTLSVHVEGINVLYDSAESTFDLSIFHLQFDDMRHRARFPVVLAPRDSGLNSHLHEGHSDSGGNGGDGGISLEASTDWLRLHCDWQPMRPGQAPHLKALEVIVQELDVKVDMDLVMECVGVLGEMVLKRRLQRKTASLFGPDAVVHETVIQAVRDVLRLDLTERVMRASENFLNSQVVYCLCHYCCLTTTATDTCTYTHHPFPATP
jgi:hypothetical protein